MSDEITPYEAAVRDLRAAESLLSEAGKAMRNLDYITDRQRRELVGWLDDVTSRLTATGQVFQRLNERTAARSPLAGIQAAANGDGPTVIMHEAGEGPRPRG